MINKYSKPEQDSKESFVRTIFDSIAQQYDITNNLMSFGLHHYWRKFIIHKTALSYGQSVLDVCCGTGSLTFDLATKVGNEGQIIGVDLSSKMLTIANNKLQKKNFKNIHFVQANALNLPFPDNTFDIITIAYGLRNVSNINLALCEMHRVTKPGGKIISLEMTKPAVPIFKEIYSYYLRTWIPWIGNVMSHNKLAYLYLKDSINNFPSSEVIIELFNQVGFKNINCSKLCWGIATVHTGFKS